MSGFRQAGSEITGKVSDQEIRLQNAYFHNVAWSFGRIFRIIVQFTGIGAIVIYIIERHIVHSDLSANGRPISHAIVAIAHLVPMVLSNSSGQQADAKKSLDKIYQAFPAISVTPIGKAADVSQAEGDRMASGPGEENNPQGQNLENPTGVESSEDVSADPRPKSADLTEQPPSTDKKVDTEDDTARSVQAEPIGDKTPPAETNPIMYSFRSYTETGGMTLEQDPYGPNKKGITVANVSELPGPASLDIVGEINDADGLKNSPKAPPFVLRENTGNVTAISSFGHMATKEIMLQKNNALRDVNFYELYAIERINIDCHIERLRLDLSSWLRNGDTELIFGDNAQITTIDPANVERFTKIVLTNGVGIENAGSLLKGAASLKEVELIFSNASEDDWRKLLAAVRKGCHVVCLNCPASIKGEFPALCFD
ncbi:MAG: hypothetical protein LBI34_01505 [Puniceicoccales bacterium]|nr:hypothetical protein [Puniceicoccales bacterium]